MCVCSKDTQILDSTKIKCLLSIIHYVLYRNLINDNNILSIPTYLGPPDTIIRK